MPSFSVEALRREFDGSFALPSREIASDGVDLLAIRVGGKPFALRVSEIAALTTGRRLTPVPAPTSELLGLVGMRGVLVAVLDLAALLGEEARNGESPRWLALSAEDPQLALGFHALEGHLRVSPAALEAVAGGRLALVAHVARTESGPRSIVSVPQVAARARALAGRARSEKGTS